jgi:hypothetical protein
MAKTSTRPMVRIHNVETDEVIDREMNDAKNLLNTKQTSSKQSSSSKQRQKPKQIRLLFWLVLA